MSLTSRKITSFAKKVTDLPDRPSPAFTPSQIKSQFDSSPEELRVALNGAVDDLTATTAGASGAHNVGSAVITGLTGATVYDQLTGLKGLSDSATAHAALTTSAHGGIAPASHVGATGSAHGLATQSVDGFMSSGDKTKLDGVATGAEVNQNAFSNVAVAGQSTVAAEIKADTLTLAGGTGITVTTNAATDTVTITATGNATPGAHATSHITGGADIIPNAVANGAAGLMSGSDKARLDTHASSHITGGTDIIPNAVANGNAGLMSGADKAALDQTVSGLSTHMSDYTLQVPYGGITTGVANTYVLASPTITALTTGMAVSVKFNVDSSGASTLNWNGKGAKGIKKSNGTDITNLKATGIYTLRYDGTNFILQGEGGGGNAIAAHLLAGETATVDAGDIVGTMPNIGADTAGSAPNGFSTVGRIYTRVPVGYWDGVKSVWADDPDFIAANILSGKDIFGLVGTLAPGKKFASGTISSDSGAFLIVSGLTFTPSYILASRASDAYMRLGFVYNVDVTGTNNVTQLSDSATTPTWNASNYVNATGFKIQVASASISYKWWAFE